MTKEKKRLTKFRLGQRVRAFRAADTGTEFDALGTVTRMRINDDAAWVELDKRQEIEGVHVFSAGDARARKVLCVPEDCEAV